MENRMRFANRVAVVTGSGRGIGEAYAKALAAEGAAIVVAELGPENGQRVAREIVAAGGQAIYVKTDVSSEESTLAMAEVAKAELGGVDYLINNAAIYGDMEVKPLVKVSMDYWHKFMAVNLEGALLCTRAVYKLMAERGGGAIINQSSGAAYMGGGYYGIAKLGLHAMTPSLARELARKNIRVNVIAPGPVDTDATKKQVPEEYVQFMLMTMPIQRLGTPDDIVGACLFLLSDEARWITGQILCVDGGQTMRP